MWFLLLRQGTAPPYFERLLSQVLEGGRPAAALFRTDPFDGRPPRLLRVAIYRYRFSDPAQRAESGAWWTREHLGATAVLGRRPSGPDLR